MSESSSGGDLRDDVVEVTLTINGRACKLAVEPRMTLLDALREELVLTGTKKGCDRGECGACTIHIEGRRVLSCMTLAAMQDGKRITTIEGMERDGTLHLLQAAFIEHDGFQCGFCTSGQIMSGVAMIDEAKAGWPSAATADVAKPFTLSDLSNAEIRERMSGNLCRCACYPTLWMRSPTQWGGAESCIPLRFREQMILRRLSRLTRWTDKLLSLPEALTYSG
jgi:xanthine dehydrogenase YagT iron-sulfur-binding subunit